MYLDSLRWYCEQCKQVVYEESFYCTDLGKQLKPVIDAWAANPERRYLSHSLIVANANPVVFKMQQNNVCLKIYILDWDVTIFV